MKIFKKIKENKPSVDLNEVKIEKDEVVLADDLSTGAGALDEMKKVAHTINEIKEQNPIQAAFSGNKNERALAENDAIISGVIKNILNWLAVITSAETVRKDEYDSITNQMLQFDHDINEQLKMQVKFKKAYESIQQRQEGQSALAEEVKRLKRENTIIKIVSSVAIVISIIAIITAIS